MSFKAVVILLAVGMMIFSCYKIKHHNPLSHERHQRTLDEREKNFDYY